MFKWFNNMKVGTKIISGFVFGAVGLGLVALMGIVFIEGINTVTNELYRKVTVSVGIAEELQSVFQEITADTVFLIAVNDAESINTCINRIDENKVKMTNLLAEYEKDIDDQAIRVLYDELLEADQVAMDKLDLVIKLAKENKDEEALVMMSQTEPAKQALITEAEIIKKIIADEIENGEINKAEFDELVRKAYLFMFFVSAIVMIVAVSFGIFISYSIKEPLKKAKHMIVEMSKGHLSERLNLKSTDEIGQMATVLDRFADSLQNTLIKTMKQISLGDVSAEIEIIDERDEVSPVLKTTIENIRKLIVEANMLSQAAVNGQLDKRGDVKAFQGSYREVIEGVNNTIDALVEPLKASADYLDRIGKGEIPEKFNRHVNGDYVKIKNSINACVEGLGAIEEGNRILGQMSRNDYSEKMVNDYLGIYGEMAESINRLHFNISYIIRFNNDMANGEMGNHLETFLESGKLSENDELIPSLIKLIENIGMLVEETKKMSESAVEGDLDNRGNSSKFLGEYAKIIEGFNHTLDAIIAPMQEASVVLNELSLGNLNTLMVGEYKGQNGKIKNDMNHTVTFLKRYVVEISNTLQAISEKNLNLEITTDYQGDFLAIKTALNHITGNLSHTISDINIATGQVEVGARQISDGGQALAQGASEQASSIQELTASIEEVSDKTKKNAENANTVNSLTGKVRDNAETGDQQMSKMIAAMSEINKSSNNISKIIKVIDDIAFQTNILALNAAVEAARAGQHGKGFAVVAEEVRTLAARSAEAAKETTLLIEGSIEKVTAGTQIADETAIGLKVISENIEEIGDLIEKIAVASNEQATEIAQITLGIDQVSKVVQTNSATAEESAAASEELSGQAEMLKYLVDEFIIKE
ncbi:methyl-accepting chemotaxis protein [Eubacteriaceae bacterium ES2]|nr:methyl-accepting chemotaxis protein [Eubacteriaceae bacterium ES2]